MMALVKGELVHRTSQFCADVTRRLSIRKGLLTQSAKQRRNSETLIGIPNVHQIVTTDREVIEGADSDD
jgi:hypothetical protein